jgi:hypothetical protein
MTHTLIKRGQARGQGGFAIGLILLVVLLIAVIIAAIALATRNGSSKGNEKARVAASSLVQQAVAIDQAILRASTSNGTQLWNQVIVNQTSSNKFNKGYNLYGSNGGLSKAPQIDKNVYAGECGGTNQVKYVNITGTTAQSEADKSADGCQWHITTVWGKSTAGPTTNLNYNGSQAVAGATGVLYTFPIKGAVGSQINSVLWGELLGKSIKVSGNGSGTATVSDGLGKNWPANSTAADGLASITPKTSLGTFADSSADFTPTATFFYGFGNGTNTVTGTSGVATLAANTAGQRFPKIGATVRREGVTQMNGATLLVDDNDAVQDGSAGARVYYRVFSPITE